MKWESHDLHKKVIVPLNHCLTTYILLIKALVVAYTPSQRRNVSLGFKGAHPESGFSSH